MSDCIDEQLKSMAAEQRLLLTISTMKKEGRLSAEQASLVRKQIMDKDPTLSFLISLAKGQHLYRELANYVATHLANAENEEETNEEFSPGTRKKIVEVAEDTSPLGNILLYRKQAAQASKNSETEFSLNLKNEF